MGATLVEYALVLSLLVVGGLGAAAYLTTGARNEVANQADCISSRPPPTNCQIPVVSTTTSTSIAPTSSSSSTTPPPGAATWDTAASTWNRTTNVVTVRMDVRTAGGVAVPEATITLRYTVVPSGRTFYGTCISDTAGTCATTWNVPFTDATQIRIDAVSISSTTPVTLPTTLTLPLP
ncbi:MAG: hypothetical protein R2726_17895 [Acidimicrobiales bacterium]